MRYGRSTVPSFALPFRSCVCPSFCRSFDVVSLGAIVRVYILVVETASEEEEEEEEEGVGRQTGKKFHNKYMGRKGGLAMGRARSRSVGRSKEGVVGMVRLRQYSWPVARREKEGRKGRKGGRDNL